jgi:hypothetical protein
VNKSVQENLAQKRGRWITYLIHQVNFSTLLQQILHGIFVAIDGGSQQREASALQNNTFVNKPTTTISA